MTVGVQPVERWERHTGAASAPLGRYRRREPEKTLLHAVVRERLEPRGGRGWLIRGPVA